MPEEFDYLAPTVIHWSYAQAQKYAASCGWCVKIQTLRNKRVQGFFKTNPSFRRAPVDRASFMRFVSTGKPQG